MNCTCHCVLCSFLMLRLTQNLSLCFFFPLFFFSLLWQNANQLYLRRAAAVRVGEQSEGSFSSLSFFPPLCAAVRAVRACVCNAQHGFYFFAAVSLVTVRQHFVLSPPPPTLSSLRIHIVCVCVSVAIHTSPGPSCHTATAVRKNREQTDRLFVC